MDLLALTKNIKGPYITQWYLNTEEESRNSNIEINQNQNLEAGESRSRSADRSRQLLNIDSMFLTE
ncbi:hypothetical protein C5167_029494, partial [Papaver somniferum]